MEYGKLLQFPGLLPRHGAMIIRVENGKHVLRNDLILELQIHCFPAIPELVIYIPSADSVYVRLILLHNFLQGILIARRKHPPDSLLIHPL